MLSLIEPLGTSPVATTRVRPRIALRWAALVVCMFGGGCANLGYAGKAETLDRSRLQTEPGWLMVEGVPELRQRTDHDCGITALDMVTRYHGLPLAGEAKEKQVAEGRWSAGELRDTARAAGLLAFVVEGELEDIVRELRAGRPVIVGTVKSTVLNETVAHYEVVIGVNKDLRTVATLDPAVGPQQNSFGGFLEEWLPTGRVLLVVMKGKSEAERPSGIASQP